MLSFIGLKLDRLLAKIGGHLALAFNARETQTVAGQTSGHLVGRHVLIHGRENSQCVFEIAAFGCSDPCVYSLSDIQRRLHLF